MDFTLPEHLPGLLAEMDAFIEAEIKPLERDHIQYFDKRREHARTDWDNDGIPTREWEDLLAEMRRRADKAGWLRYALPASLGGRDGTNLDMAVIREHLPQNFTVARVLLWRSAGRQLCRGFEAGGRRRRRVSCGDAGSFIPGVVTPFLGSRGHRGLWVRVWRGPC